MVKDRSNILLYKKKKTEDTKARQERKRQEIEIKKRTTIKAQERKEKNRTDHDGLFSFLYCHPIN
jgi:hypothetical protein